MKKIYVFGYGSLMNPKSLALTLPGERVAIKARLPGYRRVCNIPVAGYSYLNLQQDSTASSIGVLIQVTEIELENLKKRERGYECIEISNNFEGVNGAVFAFIATDGCCTNIPVPRSYLETCMVGMSEEELVLWLSETSMPGGIFEDLGNSVYENYVSP